MGSQSSETFQSLEYQCELFRAHSDEFHAHTLSRSSIADYRVEL